MPRIHPATRTGKHYQNPTPTSVGSPTLLPKILFKYLTTRNERTPRTPIGPFTTDPTIYRHPPTTGLRVTWFGHSSTLLELDGARILIDPIWDDRAAPVQWAGPRRFFPPTLPLTQLPPLDAILISHDHYDHLGAATIRQIAPLPPRWITPLGVGPILTRLGVPPSRITELNWTQSTPAGPLTLTALPARHFSGRSLLNRFQTLWASFALAGPQHRIFYGADSGEWDGFAEIARTHGPFHLTMLEIGAFDPLWADIHMGPDGAARTFAAMRTAAPPTNGAAARHRAAATPSAASPQTDGLLMPIHWGLFDLALHSWRQPIEHLSTLPNLKLFSPQPGQPTDVQPNQDHRSTWWRQHP